MLLLAVLSIKGQGLRFETQYTQDLGGPYEASNSRGRYMLIQAIVDSGTFFLNKEQAAFSLPDLTIFNGKYISIFTPGISFLAVPFYILGKSLGAAQLTTFAMNIFIGIANVYLVYALTRKIGVSPTSSAICGFLFLFGTNTLSYSTTLTQHPLSAALVLVGLLSVAGKPTILKNLTLGYMFGLAAMTDIPNILLFAPILLYAAAKQINIKYINDTKTIEFSGKTLAIALGAIPFIFAFAWYNHRLTGSYTSVPQLVGRSTTVEIQESNIPKPKTELAFAPTHFALNPRNMIRGVYTLVISSERSWIYYSPFLVVAILGLAIGSRKENTYKSLITLCLSAGIVNMIVYSLFGDPWGGWAFGPRYLIPGAAVLTPGLGIILDKYSKKIPIVMFLFTISLYSVAISLAGSLTTNLIPPKVEADHLTSGQGYNYKYNFELLFQKNQTGSLIYNTWISSKLSASQYYLIYVFITITPLAFLFALLTISKKYD